MGLGAKKAIITVVGKRCALIDVPPFLDAPLAPWRDRLKQAAAGHARLEAALEARALRDILGLVVAGKGRVNEARKLYPFGLSSEALTSMIANMKLALNKATFQTRLALAILGVVGHRLSCDKLGGKLGDVDACDAPGSEKTLSTNRAVLSSENRENGLGHAGRDWFCFLAVPLVRAGQTFMAGVAYTLSLQPATRF